MPLIEIDALPQPTAIERVLAQELDLAAGNVFITVQPVEFVDPRG